MKASFKSVGIIFPGQWSQPLRGNDRDFRRKATTNASPWPPSDLQKGNLTYQRRSGDVEIRLIVEDQAGEKTQEASRFLGRATRHSLRRDSGEGPGNKT